MPPPSKCPCYIGEMSLDYSSRSDEKLVKLVECFPVMSEVRALYRFMVSFPQLDSGWVLLALFSQKNKSPTCL